jgi:hypothetical protein
MREAMAIVRIAYVNTYRDRRGKVRHYFRRKGCKPVVLPGAPGSPELMEAYRLAIGQGPARRGPPSAGSVGALIGSYLKSPDFANLKPSSQRLYRIVLDHFGSMHGHRMVHDTPRPKVAASINWMKQRLAEAGFAESWNFAFE